MNGPRQFPLPVAARRLAGAWFVLALSALGASALLAVVLVAARTPFLGLGGAFFRTALVLHVDMAVLVWFLAAAAGLWVLARGKSDWAGWGAFWLAAAAVLLMLFSPLLGGPPPVLSNYAPVLDSPLFLTALAAFFIGVSLTAGWSLSGGWRQEGRRAPWWLASRWSVLVLGVAVFVFMRDYFFAAGSRVVVPVTFDDQVWGTGHLLQFMHGVLMIGVWSVLGQRLLERSPRLATALPLLIAAAALPTLIGVLVSLGYDVGSFEHRRGFTELMRWASWPAAAVSGLGFLLAALRMKRAGGALIAEERVLLLSVVLFLAGCLVGATIHGNATTSVPAHYHGTVGAVTLAYLMFARRLGAGFGLSLPMNGWTTRLPVVYGVGIAVLVFGLAWSGMLGVPRKAPHVELAQSGASYLVAMGLAGVGGLFALGAAAIFVGVVLLAVWRSRAAVPLAGKRDVRARALLATFAVVLVGGVLLGANESWLPGGASRAKAHVAEKKRAEIDRRFQQGVIMLHAKEYDHALTSFHRVLELAPEMPEAYVNVGFALLGKGEFSAAADFFDEATTLRRDQINAYYGLAVAMEGMGNLRGAVEAMRTYLHRAPPDDPYRVKAEAALWEWQEASRAAPPTAALAGKKSPKR